MRVLFVGIIFTVTILAFTNNRNYDVDSQDCRVLDCAEQEDSILTQVSEFPLIKDTTEFIADLKRLFKIQIDKNTLQSLKEKITTYKKLKIYGAEEEIVFVEYDYESGSGVTFPWKYQFVLSSRGELIKSMSGLRFEFIEIFEGEHPFLMLLVSTSKGNGGHEVFKMSSDTLENVYEGYYGYRIQTYDAHEDNQIYEPFELKLEVKDFNNDGVEDLKFKGEKVLIQGFRNGIWFDYEVINGNEVNYSVEYPFKKIPIEFIFIYDKETKHFKAKEDYLKIYDFMK